MKPVLLIARHPRFSLGAVEKDHRLLDEVARHLSAGHDITVLTEEEISSRPVPQQVAAVFSMARSAEVLDWLDRVEAAGVPVVNTPGGVRRCADRHWQMQQFAESGLSVPTENASADCWLKRGDGWTSSAGDTVRCRNREEEEQAKARFREQGFGKVFRQDHVEGRHVKFYGVGRGFFWSASPSLKRHAKTLAEMAIRNGVPVFGGDAIEKADGACCFIDFNDCPSFGPCRDEAALAIAQYINERIRIE